MKVLQVNKFLYPAGGTETVMFQTAELLRAHGHEIAFFGMQDERNVEGTRRSDMAGRVDYNVRGAAPLRRWLSGGRILHSREAAQKIDATIARERPDLAHLHNIYHQLSPSILGVLRRHGVPVVMTLHDYKLICPNYTLHSRGAPCERCKGRRYYQAVLQGCVKGSRLNGLLCATEAYAHDFTGAYRDGVDAFIAPSRFLQDKLEEFGAGCRRVFHVPNFVDAASYPAPGDPQPYFVYAGRLEAVKGVSTLLQAVAAVEAPRGFELRIAGDGAERRELEQQALTLGLEDVRFLGHLPREQLSALLGHAMFVVLPSEWYENAPMSVLEAYAYGKPVIASRIGGIPELIEHGRTGLLVPPGNPRALREAIDTLISNPSLAVEMGRNARRLVEERHSPERHYARLMEVYEAARHGRRGPEAALAAGRNAT